MGTYKNSISINLWPAGSHYEKEAGQYALFYLMYGILHVFMNCGRKSVRWANNLQRDTARKLLILGKSGTDWVGAELQQFP